MRQILSTIVLVSAALVVGCSTPVESMCGKLDSCGELEDETLAQCIANGDKFFAEIRKNDNSACEKIVEAFEAVIDCRSGLSCADLKKEDSETKCSQVEKDYVAAAIANAEACDKK